MPMAVLCPGSAGPLTVCGEAKAVAQARVQLEGAFSFVFFQALLQDRGGGGGTEHGCGQGGGAVQGMDLVLMHIPVAPGQPSEVWPPCPAVTLHLVAGLCLYLVVFVCCR